MTATHRSGPRRRSWLALGVALAAVLGIAVVVAIQPGAAPIDPPPSIGPSDVPTPAASAAPATAEPSTAEPSTAAALGPSLGYLVSLEELEQRVEAAGDGAEPMRTALDELRSRADDALGREPSPQNPLDRRAREFEEDTRDAYTLALAWVATQDDTYAEASAARIRAWVTEVDTVEDVCTDAGGSDCATSLLVSRNAPAFVFAAALLETSAGWTAADGADLAAWLERHILPAASRRENNWGDAGVFMRLVVADYIGDEVAFAEAVDAWRSMMDLVGPDGEIPEETRRRSQGLLYTQGAISYKAAAALVAERRGIDLWEYEGARGGTLRLAAELFARYWADPDSWPFHDGRLEIPSVDPAWELIHARWPEERYAEILLPARPLGPSNPSAVIWTTVTNGVPITDESGGQLP